MTKAVKELDVILKMNMFICDTRREPARVNNDELVLPLVGEKFWRLRQKEQARHISLGGRIGQHFDERILFAPRKKVPHYNPLSINGLHKTNVYPFADFVLL